MAFAGAPNLMLPPPLPPGWTEHVGPGGQPYYFNTVTKESTYVRPLPLPTFPVHQFTPGMVPTQATFGATAAPPPVAKKKEKPKIKTPIIGTPWLRVITNAGNVFYTHKERKESIWSVPEEIKDAVEQLEKEEREKAILDAQMQEEEKEKEKAASAKDQEDEVERVRREVEAMVGKRKAAEEPQPLDELVATKKARVDDDDDEDDDEEEEEEEEWQREAAVQLAAEAEEEEQRRKQEDESRKREEEELKQREKEKGMPTLNMPNRVDLSLDEAKALFKTLLREKDINPLLPWDTALPQFISDPRYVLLPSVAARRDAFDEYCRDRVRERRAAKLAAEKEAAAVSGDGTSEAMKSEKSPKEEFEKLLKEEVKSTRTSWSEWRKTWKKDRRFWGWGRDDREREKRFREWLKELGEQKRKAARKAEADFFALLKAKVKISSDSVWKDVKRGLDRDPRYDAVGSSSLREELFNTYVKTLTSGAIATTSLGSKGSEPAEEGGGDRKQRDKERKVRAVKEREEQVKRERGRVETDIARSRGALSREEGELEFLTLLTDAIRDPLATWDSSLAQLKTDPRFTHSPLPLNKQQQLFQQHTGTLREKSTSALHALFEAHAPLLNTPFSTLPLTSIQTSLPAAKLRLDHDARSLEDEYHRWRNERLGIAEQEFQVMLNENAFVEFWGRVRKMQEGGLEQDGMKVEVGAEDLAGEEDGEGEDARPDLRALAKGIDVGEIERVLKNDKRYTVFDHLPEQREKWIRAHVERLAAPKLSVHVPEHGP